ncbi:conserved hypothetical phage protein [Citrobacter phage CR44b]|uniref:Conserved hypothetical phage protein n=1 Tax=Citrobacter phage CR44b TaxID=1455075 RepID=W6PN51_9CAUD|nr:hypothetical protein CF82_gp15 [Citrobacter phage CR44b]CDM21542.1 conserved hypothetical phage protein [Citrobacter phage CR44b]
MMVLVAMVAGVTMKTSVLGTKRQPMVTSGLTTSVTMVPKVVTTLALVAITTSNGPMVCKTGALCGCLPLWT